MISKMREALRVLDNAEEPRPLARTTVETYGRIVRAAERSGLGYAGYAQRVSQSAPRRLVQTCFALIRMLKAALWKLRLRCDGRVTELAEHADLVLSIDTGLTRIENIRKAKPRRTEGQKRSKRRSLAGKPENLDLLVEKNLTAAARPAGLAVILTGARPAEIAKGITFRINETGWLEADIVGAKCTELSGQALRTLIFDPRRNAIAAQLAELVRSHGGVMFVTRKVRRLHKDIARAAQLAGFDDISPYVFRHWFASRRKKEVLSDGTGTREIEIAKSLGHQATKTQARYGFARQTTGEGTGLVQVNASNQVRLNHERPESYKYARHSKTQAPVRSSHDEAPPIIDDWRPDINLDS